MSQLNNSKTYHITLPLTDEKIRQFKVGDVIYLSGVICTGRDQVHKRIIDYKKQQKLLPERFNHLKGSGIYHMGPIMKKIAENQYKLVSGGPTTSSRMNPYQTEVCRHLGLKFVIGKGGMKNVNWSEIPAIYLAYPGGAGAIAAKFIEEVESVEWLDLGPPEAAWFVKIKEFGPLVVAIDTLGNSLYS